LRAIPGADRWLIVSVQGLHRFYRGRSQDVVASWMTRQDRELAVVDNVSYIASVVDEVSREWTPGHALVFAVPSQGVATAFRAAAASTRGPSGVIALGGDVPPELGRRRSRAFRPCLPDAARRMNGTAREVADDLQRLTVAGVAVQSVEFDGGHQWSPVFNAAAGEFLRRWR
jgi:hypothetical protein